MPTSSGTKRRAIAGIVVKIVSPIRRTTIPHDPCAAYWISTKKSPPSAELRKNRNETSHEKKNRHTPSPKKKTCAGLPPPRIAQPAAPTSAQPAPIIGRRFQG